VIALNDRIQTGVKGFDELVEGGLPKNSLILVTGGAGTGKSIFTQQVLVNNAKKGLKCAYISFEQKAEDIKKQMDCFDWTVDELIKDGSIQIISMNPASPKFIEYLSSVKADLLVIDSLSSLVATPLVARDIGQGKIVEIAGRFVNMPSDIESLHRMRVKSVLDIVRNLGNTTFVISEILENSPGLSRDTLSEFLADGVIILKYTPMVGQENRSIQVRKMRLTKIFPGSFSFDFSKKGIELESTNSEDKTWALKK